jgi:hypothetical protein
MNRVVILKSTNHQFNIIGDRFGFVLGRDAQYIRQEITDSSIEMEGQGF